MACFIGTDTFGCCVSLSRIRCNTPDGISRLQHHAGTILSSRLTINVPQSISPIVGKCNAWAVNYCRFLFHVERLSPTNPQIFHEPVVKKQASVDLTFIEDHGVCLSLSEKGDSKVPSSLPEYEMDWPSLGLTMRNLLSTSISMDHQASQHMEHRIMMGNLL